MARTSVSEPATRTYSTYQMAAIAIMAALLCVICPITIPIGPIPLSFSSLVLFFALYLLGKRESVICCIVYILIGALGLPVFSGLSGGVGHLLGPTGGYILGYIPMLLATGYVFECSQSFVVRGLGMIIGTLLCYAVGTLYYCVFTDTSLISALMVCVIPFLPGDFIKIVFVSVIGRTIRTRIAKSSPYFKQKLT